jgi:hypothetical protein
MLFNTLVFSAIAAFAASAKADSCSAGAIIGINAVCGTDPQDCGSGRCCLADQKCVGSGTSIACADSSLQTGYACPTPQLMVHELIIYISTTLTVNAGCYGTGGPTSSTKSSTKSSNPATIVTPTGGATATETGTGGSYTKTETKTSETKASETGSHSSKGSHTGTGGGSYVTSTASASLSSKGPKGSTGPTSAILAPYTFTNGTVGYSTGATGTGSGPKSTSASGVAQSNSATSAFTSPQNSIAIVLSAIAVVAFCL